MSSDLQHATDSLVHTSLADAKTTMERMLDNDPAYTAHVALALLQHLKGKDGHTSRRKVAAGILRKAATELARDS